MEKKIETTLLLRVERSPALPRQGETSPIWYHSVIREYSLKGAGEVHEGEETIWVVLRIMGPSCLWIILRHLTLGGTNMGP